MSEQGYLHHRSNNFGKIPAALMHNKNITDGAKVLYAHMHWRYGGNCQNWEGRESMAEYFGVSETTISNRVQELESHDWIIVVQRGINQNTGNYQTPIYHVFEIQKDCKVWRRKPPMLESEQTIREKKPVKLRKSRKGKGGNPKFKTPSTQVDPVNSGFPGRNNSSSHYPVPSHPDSSLTAGAVVGASMREQIIAILKRDGKTNTTKLIKELGQAAQMYLHALVQEGVIRDNYQGYVLATEDDAGKPSEVDTFIEGQQRLEEVPDYIKTAAPDVVPMIYEVQVEFNVDGWKSRWIAETLLGKATRAGWKEFNVSPPLVPDDVKPFVAHYRETVLGGNQNKPVVQNAEGLQSAALVWMKAGKPKSPNIIRQPTLFTPPQSAALTEDERRENARIMREAKAAKEGAS